MTASVSVAAYPPGAAPAVWQPGDFLLTHSAGWVGAAIRFGQRLRLPAAACWYNHAALVVSVDGDLIEALGEGVVRSHASKYRPGEYSVIDSRLAAAERADAVAFAESMVATPYGWWTIASIILSLLTGARFRFDRPGTVICSGLCAAALGLPEWRADPSHVMPAELAVRFGVGVPVAPATSRAVRGFRPLLARLAPLVACWDRLGAKAQWAVQHATTVLVPLAAGSGLAAAWVPGLQVTAGRVGLLMTGVTAARGLVLFARQVAADVRRAAGTAAPTA